MTDAEKAAKAWIDSEYEAMPGSLTHKLSKKAYLAGYSAAQAWRPIETAPRDGTRILAINAGNPSRQFVLYYSERWGSIYHWVLSSAAMDFVGGITHWMPLPLPPSE